MKTTIKILLVVIKWVIISGILLFSVATFMGASYLQTTVLILAAGTMIYFPAGWISKFGKKRSLIIRAVIAVLLIMMNFIFFGGEPKKSIYLSENHKNELVAEYEKCMLNWPENTEHIYIQTGYGKVHVLACGSTENPPIIMIHAASMGAHSWAENLEPLLDNYRIFSIDNIGEGNLSELDNAMVYPNSQKEIADLYALIADSLGVKSAPVFGASNGGYIAMSYAYYYPERVESLSLFGPMGLTQLTGGSIMKLSIASMYPFQFVRDYVQNWALGNDDYTNKKYGTWFNNIMKGTFPSVSQPVPMTTEQKKQMDMPVLLFLGTQDQIVGDANYAKELAEVFPNIRIEILESSHIIAVEQSEYVNQVITVFM